MRTKKILTVVFCFVLLGLVGNCVIAQSGPRKFYKYDIVATTSSS